MTLTPSRNLIQCVSLFAHSIIIHWNILLAVKEETAFGWTSSSLTIQNRQDICHRRNSFTQICAVSEYENISIDSAIKESIRWCDNFVVPLKLCPWAGASMDSFHSQTSQDDVSQSRSCHHHRPSVVFKDLPIPSGMGYYEAQERLAQLVKDEALSMLTAEKDADVGYNPDKAITFIIVVPMKDESMMGNDGDWIYNDFNAFHESVVYIEEDYLSAFEMESSEEDEGGGEEDETMVLADLVAVAGFHPDWEYSEFTDTVSDEHFDVTAISFEKKSPFPTVTIVHWSAIDKGSQKFIDDQSLDITQKISEYNAQILNSLGTEKLQMMYSKNVKLL